MKWSHIFGKNENELASLPPKLKISKSSRPPKDQLSEEIVVYEEMADVKLRHLSEAANTNYCKNNNLSPSMRKALQELIGLVKTKQVVICRTDKDDRIVIISYGDYHTIMTNQLQKFTKLSHQIDSLPKHFDSLRKRAGRFLRVPRRKSPPNIFHRALQT